MKSSDNLHKNKNIKHLSCEVPRSTITTKQEKINALSAKILNFDDYSNNNPNEILVDDLDNNISDSEPYLILKSDHKRNSISSQINETDHLQFIQMQKSKSSANYDYHSNQIQNHPDENKYVVKLPESDNEQFKHETHKRRFSNDSIIHIQDNEIYVENLQPNKTTPNNSTPYKIIVHKNTSSSTDDQINNDSDFLIKINPDIKENKNIFESFHVTTSQTQLNQNYLNTPQKTIISSPLETCIIITNRVNSGMQKMSENNLTEKVRHITHNSSYNIINENQGARAPKHDEEKFAQQSHFIEDKLQKLSTGLKAQVNVMQIPESHREKKSFQHSGDNPALREHVNKLEIIGLSYETDVEKKYYEKLKSNMLTSSVNDCAAILQSLRLVSYSYLNYKKMYVYY